MASLEPWKRIDTSEYEMDRVNDLLSPYRRDIEDIVRWEARRNDVPIEPLVAIYNGRYWTLKRESWFGGTTRLKSGIVVAKTKEEIIEEAEAWIEMNPASEAHDPLVP